LFIENDAGKPKVVLRANEVGRGILSISNAAGEIQTLLGATDRGGFLLISNPAGEQQIELGANKNGGILSIYDKTGSRVVEQIP
jgi:hypothetical protein